MLRERGNGPGEEKGLLRIHRRVGGFLADHGIRSRGAVFVVEAGIVAATAAATVVFAVAVNTGNNYPLETPSPSGSSTGR